MRGTSELTRLLSMADPPVERVALAIAADAHPALDLEATIAALDDMATPLASRLPADRDPRRAAELLSERVYEELGFHGNRDDYYDPRNSYLDDVVARRTGIPISLSVVLLALGRRAGLRVDGIGFPGHFLVRVGGEDGHLVDPFDGGRILGEQDVDTMARRFLGDSSRLEPEHLAVVDTRSIAVRMLLNLKHAHERRADHPSALVVCDRLVDVTGKPEARRDRGVHALALGSYAAAADDLEAYLEARPTARDVPRMRQALDRARHRADASPVS